nr:hypothetical protein [Tanacetum cinerariifolium]
VEAESARSYAHKLAEEKMSLLVQLDQKRVLSGSGKAVEGIGGEAAVEAASNTSTPVTHVGQSPPKASSFTTDNLSQGGRETGPKKILIEKMEGNKPIQRSDEQRNLYKALVEAYEADKAILDTYGDS